MKVYVSYDQTSDNRDLFPAEIFATEEAALASERMRPEQGESRLLRGKEIDAHFNRYDGRDSAGRIIQNAGTLVAVLAGGTDALWPYATLWELTLPDPEVKVVVHYEDSFEECIGPINDVTGNPALVTCCVCKSHIS